MGRKDRIREDLMALRNSGVVTDWYCQSGIPGLRWTVWGRGWERSLPTREVEGLLGELFYFGEPKDVVARRYVLSTLKGSPVDSPVSGGA